MKSQTNIQDFQGILTYSALSALWDNYDRLNDKIAYEVKKGSLIRLKRGYYITPESRRNVGNLLWTAANLIYGPSYISMYSALSYWNLIPEMVYTLESATIKRSKEITSPVQRFNYRNIPKTVFNIGVEYFNTGETAFLIASPAKAICDIIWTTDNLRIRSVDDARNFLIPDLRIDEDDFGKFDLSVLHECMLKGKKKSIISFLIKALERG